mmetsp:Transcript_28207/g.62236  ORF Transcript_28207/g.62236 Transcript_28207/m.62236 type:complete len:237 (-) Transcript_28207:8-718(-)
MKNEQKMSLKLILVSLVLVISSNGLEQPKATLTNCLDLGLLLLLQLLVRFLQLLDLILELLLRRLNLRLTLCNLFADLRRRTLHQLLNLRLLLVVAQVQIGRATQRLEVLVRKLLQIIVPPASLVVLQGTGVPVLDGGKPLHAVGVTERLAPSGAVHLEDPGGLAAGIVLHQLLPIRLHLLAVPAPGSVELHEQRLSRSLRFPIVLGELLAGYSGRKHQRHTHDGLLGAGTEKTNP